MDIKDLQIGKEEVKIVFIYRQHETECRKSYRINKETPRINNYRKIAGCKVNTQKSITFLYTSNE